MIDQQDLGSPKSYYDGLGDQYDFVTRVQRYDIWVQLYVDLITRHGAPDGPLLDIGCGTGKSALGFADLGYEVTGVDFSEEMLNVARGKPGAEAVNFVLADARTLPELGTYAVATTMGEPFTHMSNVSELAACMKGVAHALRPGGLFVFDLPTAGFNDRLSQWRIIDDAGDVVILWRGSTRQDGEHAVNVTVDTFTEVEGQNWRRTSEVLPCYYFSPAQVEHCLNSAGLRLETAYGLQDGVLHSSLDQQLHRKSLVVARAPE